ncbi:MAG TPA: hypothetical protein VK037_00270, partial [Pseudogracilibacillus sp.]|nr:hypothetical protein [Pseudogracilibacillus sp.]
CSVQTEQRFFIDIIDLHFKPLLSTGKATHTKMSFSSVSVSGAIDNPAHTKQSFQVISCAKEHPVHMKQSFRSK